MNELREKTSNNLDTFPAKQMIKVFLDVEVILRKLETRFLELEKSITALALLRLSEKQKRILKWLNENSNGDIIYTKLIETISKEFNIPESTARWNLKVLRDTALLEAGDKENKGIPVRITEAGRIAI
jgi:DNA-binding transcriptional ArsR family regulator